MRLLSSKLLAFTSAVTTAMLLLFAVFATGNTHAAGAKPGITVSPGQLTFSLSKDAATQTIPVTITNDYAAAVTLNAQFKGIDENAGLLVPTDTLDTTFATTLRVSDTAITLAPHETRIIRVQASNSETLAPGGHYATLVLTQSSANSQQLSLNAAISLSLFVVKVAGAHQSLALDDLKTNGWLFKLPTRADLTFRNTGNVHTVPRGVVSLLDNHYAVVAKGVANQQSLPLLPGKSLTAKVQIDRVASTWRPQRILIWTAYRADGAINPTVVRRAVWYIPPFYPAVLLIVLGGLWFTRRRWPPPLHLRRLKTTRMNKSAVGDEQLTDTLPPNGAATLDTATLEATETNLLAAEHGTTAEPLVTVPNPRPKRQTKAKSTPNSKSTTKISTPTPKKAAASKLSAVAPIQPDIAQDSAQQPDDTAVQLLTLASLQQRTTRVESKAKSTPKKLRSTNRKPAKKAATKPKPKTTS